MDETSRRREIQDKYNKEHNIIPKTIIKEVFKSITMKQATSSEVNDLYNKNMTKEEKVLTILELEEEMRAYAKDLNFEMAAQIRDAILELKTSK